MNRKMIAFLLSLLLLMAVAAVAYAEAIDIEVDLTFGQTEARSMLAMINEFRTGEDAWYWNADNTTKTVCSGLGELVYDYDLEAAAMQRAAEIAIFFSHTRPDGTSYVTAFPPDRISWGENVAAGQQTAQAAYMSWREDDDNYSGQGHRRNMLGDFNCIGIGHAVRNGVHYWTHALAYREVPNESAAAASDDYSAVAVDVAYADVTDVYAEDITLEAGEYSNYPDVLFIMSNTWPQNSSILYKPYDASLMPSWIASEPEKISMNELTFTALEAGEVTLSATVFGKTVTSRITIQSSDTDVIQVTVDGGVYTLNGETAVFEKAESKTAKTLVIADTVEANDKTYKVTAITDDACKGMSKLTKVTIGKNVTRIGKSAFSNCKVLKAVYGGAAVTAIGDSAFASCVKLTSVPVFAKLTTIGANAFKGCKALPKITISAKVKKIGKSAFYGCAKLKTIVIKTKLLKDKIVGAGAFKGIYSKPTVTCPKGMAKTYKKLLLKKGMPKKTTFK